MGNDQSAEIRRGQARVRALEKEQERETARQEALKKQQKEEDIRKQNELEKKLRELKESRAKEEEIRAIKERQKEEDRRMRNELEEKLRESKAREEALREKMEKELEEMRLQRQKEKDEEERKKKYLEPLETPWRKISPTLDDPWEQKFKMELLTRISTFKPAGGMDFINILLLGQAASGKSSFFNTCHTALMDDNRLMTIQQVYQGASSSVSKCVEAVPMETKNGEFLPIRLFDCRGLNMHLGVPTEDIRMIIQGHVKSGYSINPSDPINEDNKQYYRKSPEKKHRMHCIVYVASADNPSENLTDEKTEEQLRQVRETIALHHLPQLVLFTNIDKIEISNTNNLSDIFRSQGVKDTCDKAAKYMDIPLMNVLPMSNYHNENLPTLEKDILALFYLLTMMQRANDYIKRIVKAADPKGFYDSDSDSESDKKHCTIA